MTSLDKLRADFEQAEAAWEAGEIGSRECLERQLSQVRVTAAGLRDYLGLIKVDTAFRPIVDLLRLADDVGQDKARVAEWAGRDRVRCHG